MDEAATTGLLKRGFQVTAALAVAGALVIRVDQYAPVMLLVGAALGVAFVSITVRVVERSEPTAASRKRKVRSAILYMLKLLVAGAVFWGASRLSAAAMIAVAAGYTLPLAVLMVLALSREIARNRVPRDRGDG